MTFPEIVTAIRHLSKYYEWRETVLDRDGLQCRDCKDTVKLEVHHIKLFTKLLEEHHIETVSQAISCAGLWDAENGITLCSKCHDKQRHSWGHRWTTIGIRREYLNALRLEATKRRITPGAVLDEILAKAGVPQLSDNGLAEELAKLRAEKVHFPIERTSLYVDDDTYGDLKELANIETRSVLDELRFLVKYRRNSLGLHKVEAKA